MKNMQQRKKRQKKFDKNEKRQVERTKIAVNSKQQV
jgi:hypothetical protein